MLLRSLKIVSPELVMGMSTVVLPSFLFGKYTYPNTHPFHDVFDDPVTHRLVIYYVVSDLLEMDHIPRYQRWSLATINTDITNHLYVTVGPEGSSTSFPPIEKNQLLHLNLTPSSIPRNPCNQGWCCHQHITAAKPSSATGGVSAPYLFSQNGTFRETGVVGGHSTKHQKFLPISSESRTLEVKTKHPNSVESEVTDTGHKMNLPDYQASVKPPMS